MNAFRNPFLLIVLFCSLFLVKCTCEDDDPEPEATLIEKISKTWKISSLTVNGDDVTTGIDAFTLTLNQSGDQPTNFTVVTGGLAYNFAGTTAGNWSVNNVDNPTQATFADNTVSFSASETQLTISYPNPDKQSESIRFVLVPR